MQNFYNFFFVVLKVFLLYDLDLKIGFLKLVQLETHITYTDFLKSLIDQLSFQKIPEIGARQCIDYINK